MRNHLSFLGELLKPDFHYGIREEFNNFKKLYRTAIRDAKVNINNNLINHPLTLSEQCV